MSHLEERGREAGVYYSAAELMRADFPEPKWALVGFLVAGLNLIAAVPKWGKSWFCLALAIAVASGGRAFGKVPVDQGDVLYLALEDTPRRLQNRLAILLGHEPVPSRLTFVTSMPRLPEAAALVSEWLHEHPDARLVIVDVLRRVRPKGDERSDMYGRDYDALAQLKRLADEHDVAVLVVHHLRKMDAEDPFDMVSGSNGIAAACDTILVAKRLRNSTTAELHITGRDVEERKVALEWDVTTCTWTLLEEPVAVVQLGETRRRIVEHLTAVQAGTPTQVADALGIKLTTAKVTLRRMADDRQVDSDGHGLYMPVTPVTAVTQPTEGLQRSTGLQVVREE